MTDKMIDVKVRISKSGLEDIETILEVYLDNWREDLKSEVGFYIANNNPAYANGSYMIIDIKF